MSHVQSFTSRLLLFALHTSQLRNCTIAGARAECLCSHNLPRSRQHSTAPTGKALPRPQDVLKTIQLLLLLAPNPCTMATPCETSVCVCARTRAQFMCSSAVTSRMRAVNGFLHYFATRPTSDFFSGLRSTTQGRVSDFFSLPQFLVNVGQSSS